MSLLGFPFFPFFWEIRKRIWKTVLKNSGLARPRIISKKKTKKRTFTAVHKDGIDDFHEHLNRQNADIQFTKEIEENGKIPFLDCLVTRDNNKLKTTIYRKPTHTDRLLDQSSYNPTSHKATTIRTLTRRAQLVCDSPDSLQDETGFLNNLFSKNNYNTGFVRRNTHSNTDSNTQTNSGPVTTATIPYIRGTSETIARILQPYNIRVAHKNGDVNNHIAEHHLQTKHQIDRDSATCIIYFYRLLSTSYFRNLVY